MNPLLENNVLAPYSKIQPKHVVPSIETILDESKEAYRQLLTQQGFTWKNLVDPIQEIDNRLGKAWSPVEHMNAVVNSNELRDEYTRCLPKLSEFHTDISQNKVLFDAIKSVQQNDKTLDSAQQKIITDYIRSFELSGVALDQSKQDEYKDISQKLSLLSSRFSDNVLDSTNAWYKQFSDVSALAGLPDSMVEQARSEAQQRDLDGWVVTLAFPSFNAVVTYADDRSLRAEVYEAYVTRASEFSPNTDWDNSQVMADILKLRLKQANLTGFKDYSERSVATKMAESSEEVLAFLYDLLSKAKPIAEKEFAALCLFAEEELGISDLSAWDVAYASEKLKQQTIGYSDEDLKPWFSADNVLKGLFDLVSQLYKITITQREDADVWHPDVRFYEIYDQAGQLRAQFYLDLYARRHKRGGAWMSDYCSRYQSASGIQVPVANMTCNSSRPTDDKPALFTHDEVITLFHEFGHGLHHMLTQVDYLDASGINGVEWDAVELPSQFMENFCWERESLDLFAHHYETGEGIPDDLFAKMKNARSFQSAMMMVRQLEFSIFDMRIHQMTKDITPDGIQNILNQTRKQSAVVQAPDFNRFQNSFSHIFAGGYAAGYYSYKWAEVLSADAFAKFEEDGLFNAETGLSFLTEVLEMGGSRPALESFKAFRGREPQINALLKHSGILVS